MKGKARTRDSRRLMARAILGGGSSHFTSRVGEVPHRDRKPPQPQPVGLGTGTSQLERYIGSSFGA